MPAVFGPTANIVTKLVLCSTAARLRVLVGPAGCSP